MVSLNFSNFAAFVDSCDQSKAGYINRIDPQDLEPASRLMQFFNRVSKDQLLDNNLWNRFKQQQPVLSGAILMNNSRAQKLAYMSQVLGPLLKEPGSSAVSLYDGIPKEYQQGVQRQRMAALLKIANNPSLLNMLAGNDKVNTKYGNISFYSAISQNPNLTWVIPTMTQHPELKKLIPTKELMGFMEMYPAMKDNLNLSSYEKVKMTLVKQNPLNTAINFGSHIPSKDDYGVGLEALDR